MKKVIELSGLLFFMALMTTFNGCKKDAELPVLSSPSVSGITKTSAVVEGGVISDGGAEVTSRGVCWSYTHHPPSLGDFETNNGAGTGTFSSVLTGLSPNTTYYVRAYAINKAGINYGNDVSFKTFGYQFSILTTADITDVNPSHAVSGGNITDDGGSEITSRGVCWSTGEMPTTNDFRTTDGTGTGSFTSNLTDLNPGTTYYVRAYASNNAGVSYGNQLRFTTGIDLSPINFNPDLTYGSVTDADGNIYKTIQIGNQTWMAENLKTTKYNDGTSIPEVTDNNAWGSLVTGGYSWYNNDASSFKNIYGALYNWYAVTDNRNVCPAGWHVPAAEEWNTLASYLGGNEVAGAKTKETGTLHWLRPNTGATNESGFTALPGGLRSMNGDYEVKFVNLLYIGSWWSTTPNGPSGSEAAMPFSVWYDSAYGLDSEWLNYKTSGLSVRCIKN